MDSLSSIVTPILALFVSVGSLMFAYRKNNEAEASGLIGLLQAKIKLLEERADSAEKRLDDCESARSNLAGENVRLMRLLLVPPYGQQEHHDA